MRQIKEIRNDIIELKKDIPEDTWNDLTKLLDEVFMAYMIEAKKHDVLDILEDIGHLERNCPKALNIHQAIAEFKNIVELKAISEAKMEYDTKKLFKETMRNY